MDGDIPWIYVAMIFIAFVSWVKSRLDEAAKVRRQRAAAREAARRERRESRPADPPSPYRPLAETSRTGAPAPDLERPLEDSRPVPTSFREFFEMVQEAAAAPSQAAPPPLPKSSTAPEPAPAPAPAQVAERAKKKPVSAPPPKVGTALRVPRTTRLLQSRSGLRDAMVLKEILDPPVSMR